MESAPSSLPPSPPPSHNRGPLVVFVIIVMCMLGVVVTYGVGRLQTTPASTSAVIIVTPRFSTAAPPTLEPITERQRAGMETVIAHTRHFRGDPKASVKLVEFGDFQ